MWLPTQNPPLCLYRIAIIASVVCWNEVGLHAAFMLPAIAAVLRTFAIAQQLCGKPLIALPASAEMTAVAVHTVGSLTSSAADNDASAR
jgi:hypothetical protein